MNEDSIVTVEEQEKGPDFYVVREAGVNPHVKGYRKIRILWRPELNRLLEKNDPPAAVLLEYGGNDADFRWDEVAARPFDEHLPNTPLPVFTETMRRMVESLRAHNVRPVLSTLPPISSERYLNWITRDGLSKESILTWLGDENAIYRYQENYSRAIERLAGELSCTLVDLRSAFLEKRMLLPYLCEDGIHPNDAGQRLIHEVLAEVAAKA